VAAKVREVLAKNKQAEQKFDVKRFNLRKLSELDIRKQYQIKISNRFAGWEAIQEWGDLFKDYYSILGGGGGAPPPRGGLIGGV